MKKIVHFVIDDKFIDSAIELFESLEGYQNEYYVLTAKTNDFLYIKSKNVKRIHYDNIIDFVMNRHFCDYLILHSFYSLPSYVIVNIHNSVRVLWFSWGYDIYENTYPGFPLVPLKHLIVNHSYQDEPISIRNKVKLTYNNFEKRIDFWKKYFFEGGRYERKLFIKAVKRIDYYSGVFPMEYSFLQKKKFFKAKPLSYNYPGSKGSMGPGTIYQDPIINGNSIQVGHSAVLWANHIEAFHYLKKINIRDRKVICPLSYGDAPYADYISEIGTKMFKSNFQSIRHFMPFDDYKNMTDNVSMFILYAMRQGAVGNIIMNLWRGAKVYLPTDSIGYKHFKQLGIRIFSIEKDLTQENIDTPLLRDEIINNRRILSNNYSYEVIRNRLIQSLSSIN